jgi:multidrug resistance efflux pump
MKHIANKLINAAIFLVVILLAVGIATFALTKKVNEYSNQYSRGIQGSVMKREVPLVATSRGSVQKVYVSIGDSVKKEEPLVELENAVLGAKIKELEKNPDNVSAQTEAGVAKEELKGLTVYAPVDGVIKDISIVEGSPVDQITKVGTLYSNDDVKISTQLSLDEYVRIRNQHAIMAYCPRLNQMFGIQLDTLKPEEKNSEQGKKLGVYFTFQNKQAALSVLQNEDLEIRLEDTRKKIEKPVDVFINFWNGLLSKNDEIHN